MGYNWVCRNCVETLLALALSLSILILLHRGACSMSSRRLVQNCVVRQTHLQLLPPERNKCVEKRGRNGRRGALPAKAAALGSVYVYLKQAGWASPALTVSALAFLSEIQGGVPGCAGRLENLGALGLVDTDWGLRD